MQCDRLKCTLIIHRQLYYQFLSKVFFFLSVTVKPRGTRRREDKQRQIGFDVGPSRTACGFLGVGRFNHRFTFISPRPYLFVSCPSGMHHLSAQHRGMHHAIIERLYPLCSDAKGWILSSRQADIRAGIIKKSKKQNWKFNHFYPFQCVIMIVDLCGPSSLGASRELFCSAGVSYMQLERSPST